MAEPTDKAVVDASDDELQTELRALLYRLRDIDLLLKHPQTGEHQKAELRTQRNEVWKQMEYPRAELNRRQTLKLQQSANALTQDYVRLTGNYVKLTRWLAVIGFLSIVATLLATWCSRK